MKAVRTLIFLADDKAARFLLNEGVGKGLRELSEMNVSQFPQDSLEYSDRPSRSSGGAPMMGRHGVDPHTNLAVQHRARFADHLIQALEQEWQQARADRLIIAAPAKMLGVLRGRLPAALAAALAADLSKDLLKIPLIDLPGHFADLIAL